MRFVVLLSALLLLSGCASIPLSTMATFSQFDEHTLITLDPEQMRVKVSVGDDFSLQPDSTKLQLTVQLDKVNKSSEAVFGLVQLSKVSEKRATGLFSADMEVTTYQFKIDQAGVNTLKQLQTQIKTAGAMGSFSLNVETDFEPKEQAKIVDEVVLWIDVQLSSVQGYIPLFDAAKLELKKV